MATQSESESESIIVPIRPWILFRNAEIDEPAFGSKTAGWWFIETDKYGGNTVISLRIDEWPEQVNEKGEYYFKLLLQEEGYRYHNVCEINLVLDSNYKFIRESIYDKYNDAFKIGWDGVAGCPDWYSHKAAGLEPIQRWNPKTQTYEPSLDIDIEQDFDDNESKITNF